MLRRIAIFLTLFCATLASAQQGSKVSLNVSETLFSVLTAINACGYDQDLASSDPLRLRIRNEVNQQVQNSHDAQSALKDLCTFYRDHQQPDASRELSQYVSLALNLEDPPAFAPKVKEADLPPDASYVLGIQHMLQVFYSAADLHSIWLRHQKDYESFYDSNNEALARVITATDVYLKIPVGGYAGRHLNVLIEPMAAPSQSNARSYDPDYYIVVSPEKGVLPLDQIRHAYLHFILDPMAMKRGTTMQRLMPLLDAVKQAPMDNAYKTEITLLVTESLLRAIEARTLPGKGPEAEQRRRLKADIAAREGFILTPYFFDQLIKFEKDPTGLQDAYGDWLYYIDVPAEKRRAGQIQFAASSAPDVLHTPKTKSALDQAETYLASGDYTHARELAQKALDSRLADPGRCYFVLARVDLSSKNMDGAQQLFLKALDNSKEPWVLAWSNIYLGRIFDLKSDRETALKHYRAALQAGESSSFTRNAAERGLKQPYQPPPSQSKTPETTKN